MDRKKILDAIEEMVDEVRKYGCTPHALICSRKTLEKIAIEIHALSPLEEKFIPLEMLFKYEFGDLPIVKFKYCPEDKVFVVDKDTYERVMEAEKEFSQKTHSIFDKYPCELLKGKYK